MRANLDFRTKSPEEIGNSRSLNGERNSVTTQSPSPVLLGLNLSNSSSESLQNPPLLRGRVSPKLPQFSNDELIKKIFKAIKANKNQPDKSKIKGNETAFELINAHRTGSLSYAHLAKGGQGVVTKWELPSLKYAEKAPLSNNKADLNHNEEQGSLQREIAFIRKIDSDHVISAQLNTEDSVFLEFADNGSLLTFSKTEAFDSKAFLQTLKGASQGLVDLHKAKVIHRDIKPENFLVFNKPEETKIADLGCAIDEIDLEDDSNQNTFGLYGTYGFLAPEVYYGYNYGDKSDVFSFGASLYQLLTGKLALPSSLSKIQDPNTALFQSRNWINPKREGSEKLFKDLLADDMKQEAIATRVKSLDPTGYLRELMLSCLDLDPTTRPNAKEVNAFLNMANQN